MISIAMATYNGEKYLREQLDSVLNQTITDFELVICDDKSTDSTIDILSEYAAQDKRIRYYVNPVNIGFKRNFENVIQKCKGEYIALCDQDDIWYPEHIERLYQQIGKHSISCANSILVDKDNNSLEILLSDAEKFYVLPADSHKLIYKVLLSGNPFQGASMLMPTAFVHRCLPIPEGVCYHDAWFAACACLDNGITYSFDPITRYRQHGNNVTANTNRTEKRTIRYYLHKTEDVLRGKKTLYTDRFNYIEALRKRFGTKNKDFIYIYDFIDSLQKHSCSIYALCYIVRNYQYVATYNSNSKRGLLKDVFVWLHWRPIPNSK